MKTAKELRAQAREALKGRYWWAFLASLIAAVLGGVAGSGGSTAGGNSAASNAPDYSQLPSQLSPEQTQALLAALGAIAAVCAVLSILWMIIGGCVELGYNAFNLELYKTEEKPAMNTLFSRFSILGRAFWLRLLMSIKILLWTLLLVVPGIIAAYRYAMAPYLLAENPELTAKEAIEQSKVMMAGNKWRLFCLQLSFIGWYLLGALAFGLGILFVTPYSKAADAAFYLELKNSATSNPTPELT